jgi:hypothetical protein
MTDIFFCAVLLFVGLWAVDFVSLFFSSDKGKQLFTLVGVSAVVLSVLAVAAEVIL